MLFHWNLILEGELKKGYFSTTPEKNLREQECWDPPSGQFTLSVNQPLSELPVSVYSLNLLQSFLVARLESP